MNFKLIFCTSLLIAGCAFVKVSAFPQDGEPDSTLTDSNSPDPTEMDLFTENSNTDNSFGNDPSVTEGGDENFILDPDVDPTETPFLTTATEIRQYLVSKLREIYRSLKGCKSKMDVEKATLLDFDHLPKFQDPLYVGNFTEKYKLADVSFYNVAVRGMNDFRSADMHTDQEHRNVDLQLVAPSLQITGNYFLKNFFKKTSGPFNVKLRDNITYHEASIYCQMKQEIDIATSKCGIRYGKSENNYVNLGWFTGLFRGAISNPMIDQVLQKVGKEIGHKMRPILLNMLQKTVIGKDNDTTGSGLAALIRSTVSETRNLMMKDEYKNFQVEGDAKVIQYGTYDVSFQTIELHGVNRFEIIGLDLPVLSDKLVVHLTVHDMNINGSANIQFSNRGLEPKTESSAGVNRVPFEIEDLRVEILLEKQLSSDVMKFDVSSINVTVSKLVTHPPQESIVPEIEVAVRDFVPNHLPAIISERLTSLIKSHIENILNDAATEESDNVDQN